MPAHLARRATDHRRLETHLGARPLAPRVAHLPNDSVAICSNSAAGRRDRPLARSGWRHALVPATALRRMELSARQEPTHSAALSAVRVVVAS